MTKAEFETYVLAMNRSGYTGREIAVELDVPAHRVFTIIGRANGHGKRGVSRAKGPNPTRARKVGVTQRLEIALARHEIITIATSESGYRAVGTDAYGRMESRGPWRETVTAALKDLTPDIG